MIVEIFKILLLLIFGCLSLRTYFYTKLGNISKRTFFKNNLFSNLLYISVTLASFLGAIYLSIGLKWYFLYIIILLPLPSITNSFKSSYSSRISRYIKLFEKLHNSKSSNPNSLQESLRDATKVYLRLKQKPEIATQIYNELFGITDIEPDNLKDTLRLLLRAEDTYEYKVFKETSNMDFIIYPGVDDAIKKHFKSNNL